jgi:hypothetical protein
MTTPPPKPVKAPRNPAAMEVANNRAVNTITLIGIPAESLAYLASVQPSKSKRLFGADK